MKCISRAPPGISTLKLQQNIGFLKQHAHSESFRYAQFLLWHFQTNCKLQSGILQNNALKYNITITNCLTFQPNIVLHWAVFKTKSRVKYSKCVCVNQWFIHGAVWGLETERVCSSLCEVELDVWKWDYMWCLNNKGQWLSIGRKPERICHSKSQLR